MTWQCTWPGTVGRRPSAAYLEQQELILAGTHPACSPKMPPNPHVLSGSTDVFFSALKSKLPALHDSMAIQTAVLFFTSCIFPIIYWSKGGKSWETGEDTPACRKVAALASAQEPVLSSAPSTGGVSSSPVTEDAQAYPGLLPQLLAAILLCWTASLCQAPVPCSPPPSAPQPVHADLELQVSGFVCSVFSLHVAVTVP